MATATTNMGLTKPDTTDPADIAVLNQNMEKLDGHRHLGGSDGLAVKAVQSGLLSARPTDVTAGQLYVATDTSSLHLANGTAWSELGAQAGNLLANGGFEVWQRGSGPFTTNDVYTADKWRLYLGGTATASASRETGIVARVSNSSLKVVATASAANKVYISGWSADTDGYPIADTVLSWSLQARSSAVGGIRIGMWAYDSGWTQVADALSGYNQVTGEWETLSATLVVPSNGRKLWFEAQIVASGTYYLDNAMMAHSPAPARYTPLPPAEELARCQRYYEKFGTEYAGIYLTGHWCPGPSSYIVHPYSFRTWKAATPTMTKAGTWYVGNCNQPQLDFPTPHGFALTVQTTGSTGANVGFNTDTADDYIAAQAESW